MAVRKKHTRFLSGGRVFIGGALVVVLVAAVGGTTLFYQEKTKQSNLIDPAALAKYEQRDGSGIDRSYVAPGVAPPINKWFSGIAFSDEPEPVVAYPNSYQVQGSGLKVGVPTVKVSADAVESEHRLGATITIQEAVSFKVIRYDHLSVDIAYYDARQREIAVTTLMAGVPVAPIVAKQPIVVEMSVERPLILQSQGVGGDSDQWFGLQQADGRPKIENDRITSRLKEGQFASIYTASSREKLDVVATYALNRPMNVTVEYRNSPRRITTEINIRTANNQPTVMALLPHQQSEEYATIAEYSSPFGSLPLVEVRTLIYRVPPVAAAARVVLSGVSDESKSDIISQLHRDVAATQLDAGDPDEGGKQLQRAAQLLLLADELDQEASAAVLVKKLNRAFDDWLSPRSDRGFYFDTGVKGMAAKQLKPGQKTFDRHHNMYGYFLYAAGVLARFDGTFVERQAQAVNLLAADIGGYKEVDVMATRRSYDPYRGHSWELGVPLSDQGNQQVASAEAINAWNGLVLWARAIENSTLEDQALWLLANETASAKRYQTNISIAGYEHASFGARWGSKRTWETPLQGAPNAPVGLQLSPMTPAVAASYRSDSELLARLLDQPELVSGARFSDALIMAEAVKGSDALAGDVLDVDSVVLEPSMSKSYVMAFIASETARSQP